MTESFLTPLSPFDFDFFFLKNNEHSTRYGRASNVLFDTSIQTAFDLERPSRTKVVVRHRGGWRVRPTASVTVSLSSPRATCRSEPRFPVLGEEEYAGKGVSRLGAARPSPSFSAQQTKFTLRVLPFPCPVQTSPSHVFYGFFTLFTAPSTWLSYRHRSS